MTETPDELTGPQRRGLRIEIVVVLAVTFGLSAYTALLQLIEAVLLGLAGQRVALNPRRSPFDLIDLGLNLAVVFQLVAWGFLGSRQARFSSFVQPPGAILAYLRDIARFRARRYLGHNRPVRRHTYANTSPITTLPSPALKP